MTEKRLFGLIGYPLSHSFSAKYFNEKFEEQGLNCRYENFEFPTLPDLNALRYNNPGLIGLNVTIPYKSDVMLSLHSVEKDAEQIGAVNVIHFNDGLACGYNTDYLAFKETLEKFDRKDEKALILGTGGASKAVAFALNKMGIEARLVSSSKKENSISYNELDRTIIESHNLIINTTPLGNYPKTDACPPIPYEFLNEAHLLYDLIYNPSESLFLKKGVEKGCDIKNGYDMLVRQAELSWEIWNQ